MSRWGVGVIQCHKYQLHLAVEAIPTSAVPLDLDAKSPCPFGTEDPPIMVVAKGDPESAELGPETMVFPSNM